jgi:glycosyltransferase involved in cell wall biosynthesis
MLNILGFALYGSIAASHRVRLGQYQKGLLAEGINLHVQSVLGNDYLQTRFQSGRRPYRSILNAGLERLRLLIGYRRFDAAIVHCELFPLVPGWLERAALRIPYIYDFDDAFYLRYQGGNLRPLRFLLGGKFDNVIRGAAAVTAGNTNLATYACALNSNVTVLPSVVDTSHYLSTRQKQNSVFTVGWIGSPSTAKYLHNLVAPLQILGRNRRLRLVVIGGKAPHVENVEVLEIPWSADSEVDLINTFDVGLMPLPNNEWARGKCAFKLVQYMACGVPVVASRVGANIELVTAECGFLAETDEQWVEALRQLGDKPLMRSRMGASSRKRVEDAYSLESNLPLMANVIHKVVGKN